MKRIKNTIVICLFMVSSFGIFAQDIRPLTKKEVDNYRQLSPFEFKNILIDTAQKKVQTLQKTNKSAHMRNAGRGNPNFINTTARLAFAHLHNFAVQIAAEKSSVNALGYRPDKNGIAAKLDAYLKKHSEDPAAVFLGNAVAYAEKELKMLPDDLVFELSDGILGDFYPSPSRMQTQFEKILHEYISQIHFRGKRPEGKFELFATEGATAAMIYIFKSLQENFILLPGEKIAIITPIFSPYLEIPVLRDYQLVPIYLHGDEASGWQLDEKEVAKLEDKTIKAVFMVNPMNPSAVSMSVESVEQLEKIVSEKRQDLIILSDTVYCPFVDDFHDPLEKIPANCIGVFSLSKYFGVTGWRLGVIFVHENNIVDKLLAKLPEDKKALLRKRYDIVSENPDEIKFIDRLVMDSRDVALAHTGGLSTPQQCIMTLFALFDMMDVQKKYKKSIQSILTNRETLFFKELGIQLSDKPGQTHYYALLNMLELAKARHGKEFEKWLKDNYSIFDMLLYLASQKMIVLLPGQGFAGPEWSFRISLANLPDEDYTAIGKGVAEMLDEFSKAMELRK